MATVVVAAAERPGVVVPATGLVEWRGELPPLPHPEQACRASAELEACRALVELEACQALVELQAS